ncbi:MAG: ribonuclease P protein component [Patescibacteria group bacterium]
MLPRKYKLKRDNDFKRVFKQGRYFQESFIRLRVLKNESANNRFAFIVGLKISKKAIGRNKIRRQLEEVIRLNLNKIKKGFDIVVLPEKEIISKSYSETEKTLLNLLKISKLTN